MTVAFVDTWIPNGPFPIVESSDVRGGYKILSDIPIRAQGHITCVGEASIADGDTFVIDDGVNAAVTFEFDKNASVVEIATLRAVNLTGGETSEAVAQLIITAVAGAPTLDITATSAAGIGGVALAKDNVPGAPVAITQGGTSPLFVLGMVGNLINETDQEILIRAIAYNEVAPHNRVAGMLAGCYEDNNAVIQHVRWNGTDFIGYEILAVQPNNPNRTGNLSGYAYFGSSGVDGDARRLTRGSAVNERIIQTGSEESANQAAGFRVLARDAGNNSFEASFYVGPYYDMPTNSCGILLSELHPTFIIGEDSYGVGSADIDEIFSARLVVAGDPTESEFHFYADEGGFTRGIEINVDTVANAVTIRQTIVDADLLVVNEATGPGNNIIIRTSDPGGNVAIETGTLFDSRVLLKNINQSNYLSGTAFTSANGQADTQLGGIPVDGTAGEGTAVGAHISRNNSAVSFESDFGNIWVGNENSAVGGYSMITFQTHDQMGSFPHFHVYAEQRVASPDAVQNFGIAVSDGTGGVNLGEKLIAFEDTTTIRIGGSGVSRYSGLDLVNMELLGSSSGSNGNVTVEIANLDGQGFGANLAVEGDALGSNTCYLRNQTTETLDPAGTAVGIQIILSSTDSLHAGGFVDFQGENVSGVDATMAVNLDRGAGAYDSVKVRVEGNVRWIRCYDIPD